MRRIFIKTQWVTDQNEKTPFNPLKEFDRIVGEQCRENQTWRKIAILAILSFFVSLGIIFYALNLPKTVPLVVLVSEWGESKYIGDISKFSYHGTVVPEVALQYQLRQFITNLYSIPLDAAVLRSNIEKCYSSLTGKSAPKLSALLKADNPFNDFGVLSRSVLIESILSLSKNSYQVDFIITSAQFDGKILKKERSRAIFTTALLEPSKEDQLLNPLGIYITNFDFTLIGDIK